MNAIEVRHVSKIYRRYARRKQFATLKSALLSRSLISDLKPDQTFSALKDVSFTVPRGRTLGIIGSNGSGKSTMLKLVAGITKPTSGSVKVNGRVSALIELGAGFHPEISGRENVFINGIMLGLSKREIGRRFDEIVDFAELQDFIDAPVKTYSSGMYMRLGFAVAIHVDPDVLLVDEVLAVGDEGFTHKCLDKFSEFRRRGKTILLVSHSLNLIERFCDEAVWLDAGVARAQGDPKRVVGAYLTKVEEGEETLLAATTARAVERASAITQPDTTITMSGQAPQAPSSDSVEDTDGAGAPAAVDTGDNDGRDGREGPDGRDGQERREGLDGQGGSAPRGAEPTRNMFEATEGRWGSREIEIVDVALLDRDGQPSFIFHSGEPVSIRLKVRAAQPADDFVFGVGLFNAEGVCCYGTNTDLEEMYAARLSGDAEATFAIDGLDLVEGTYKLDVAVHKRDGFPYDYHRQLYTFRVKSRTHDVGIYRPRHRWEFSSNVQFKATRDDR